ncbi:DNA polymerase III subunit delta' [Haliea sp. AH-315-K21]|nr:DNA polymerase III subunit delta' [Haliea sp. AH-315-K21]MBN4075866.1 DNA polymerase III subunit delta' [Gammaproteobacteria bacterium AH-315-E17]
MSVFNQLPWNQSEFDKLAELEHVQQLGHAYLVQGQKGVGKESLVRDFSAYLLCQKPQKQTACGECQTCHLFSVGTHPDFKYIGLEEGASQIKIEQVRDSRNFLANTSLMGKYKILLIHSAEKMNVNAANALLKNLEEPASDTLLFLLSHQPSLLLPTIRSRCQKIKMSRPNEDLALQWLQQHVSKEQARLNLQLAYGAPLLALNYANEDRQQERREIQKRLLELLRSQIVISDAAKVLSAYPIEDVLENFMHSLQQISRNLHLQNEELEADLSTKELQDITSILTVDDIKPLHKFHSKLIHARRALQSTANPNAQLLLESLCYQWIKLVGNKQSTGAPVV